MSVDLSGEIAAMATAVLAVFAIVTAVFAVLAFRKQSREVRAIERQVTDQQELTQQQAELLKVQSGQLELQRQQFDEQRQVNAKQVKVLELQAQELRASLDAREQESLALRYQYASTIAVWQEDSRRTSAGWIVEGHVRNTGNRPVRDVSVHWYKNNKLVGDRKQLAALLLPDEQKEFQFNGGGAGHTAIVQFRTVGDDWWSAGTDGGLLGGLVMGDAPPRSLPDDEDLQAER